MSTEVASLFASLGLVIDEKSWAKGDKLIGDIKKGIAAYLSFKGLQGIANVVTDVVDLGGKFADASQKTGVSAETLQEWGYAAGLAGSSADEVIASLGKLNKGLGEAAKTGKGPAADGLRSLGLSLSDPAIKAGNLDEVLLNIANKFAAMPDGPKKVAAAMDLFGKSGANLIPTLNQGASGIEALKAEAKELGVVIDNDTIGALDNLGDDVDRAKAGWQGFKNQLVIAILPLVQELLPPLIALMKRIGNWAKEHKQEIAAVFYAALKVVEFLWEGLKFLARLLFEVAEMVYVVVKAIIKGFIAAGKWIVKVAGSILKAFGDAWDWIKDKAQGVWDFLSGIGTSIIDTFVSVGEGIIQAFKDAFNWVIKKAEEVGTTLRNLPVIKQLGDLGEKIGSVILGDNKADSAYENARRQAKATNQPFDMTEDQFNAQQRANAERVQQQMGEVSSVAPKVSGPVPTYSPPPGTMMFTDPDATQGSTYTTTINVHPSPGMDEKALGAATQKAFDENLARVGRHLVKEKQ